jgi:hypothetical protein
MVVYQDGEHRMIANSYRSIKLSMNGATISSVGLPNEHSLFVDDEGMLVSLTINVPASIFAGIVLYGPVVLCGPPDTEGETMPPDEHFVKGLSALATMWGNVVKDARQKGQEILTTANPDTIPPPQVVSLTEEQFDAWMRGEWNPNA